MRVFTFPQINHVAMASGSWNFVSPLLHDRAREARSTRKCEDNNNRLDQNTVAHDIIAQQGSDFHLLKLTNLDMLGGIHGVNNVVYIRNRINKHFELNSSSKIKELNVEIQDTMA